MTASVNRPCYNLLTMAEGHSSSGWARLRPAPAPMLCIAWRLARAEALGWQGSGNML